MKRKLEFTYIPPVARNMRVYANINVTLTYQNFGSAWLGILRGAKEDIELVFNGLFNFGATNGELHYYDHNETLALFWSSEEDLQRFFYNVRVYSGSTRYLGKEKNLLAAAERMEQLKENCQESFMNFSQKFQPDVYSVGTISAERPDNDFKDHVLTHAFNHSAD